MKKAPVLLLGKSTSALDAESEGLRWQALDRMADQRTTIVIAHRLATVQKAELLLSYHPTTLQPLSSCHGKRPQRQTHLHSDLTQGAGLYARFAALQFSRRHGRQSRLADSCTRRGVGFPKGPRRRPYVSCLKRRPTITGGHANYN